MIFNPLEISIFDRQTIPHLRLIDNINIHIRIFTKFISVLVFSLVIALVKYITIVDIGTRMNNHLLYIKIDVTLY